jgi:PadR family transcriptional regulator, regulatory protein PadR
VYGARVLREPTFLILAAIAPAPLHGYGIMQSVEELSDGRVCLRAGTLYAALDRLVDEGALVGHREEVIDGRLRRYYKITAVGRALLNDSIALLDANAAAGRRQLALKPKRSLL